MKKLAYKIIVSVHEKLPDIISLALENTLSRLRGANVRFGYEDGLYFVSECGVKVYFDDKNRGFYLYRNGIEKRGVKLAKSYCLNHITFDSKSIVIDCGANYGDLFLYLKDRMKKENYFAVEPSPNCLRVLKKNIENVRTINCALGDKNGFIDFFISDKSADSSVIKPRTYESKKTVEMKRLDTLIEEEGIERIKLLKLEAEGFEPEILFGLGSLLSKVEYIAVDGGYERGVDEEQTLTSVTNFLLSNNYELIDIYFPWYRALFKRTV